MFYTVPSIANREKYLSKNTLTKHSVSYFSRLAVAGLRREGEEELNYRAYVGSLIEL